MASAKYENGKCKDAKDAKARLRHNVKDSRMKIKKHSNDNIDPTKTQFNYSFTGLKYDDACKKYDDRIELLDSTTNKNKRKDRVTLYTIEVPCPNAIPPNDRKRFFKRVLDTLNDTYGERNLIDASVHVDEVHDYVDAETGKLRTSCEHIHISYIPEIDGQLNAKRFSARQTMISVNNKIHAMSMKEFNVPFCDGTKRVSKKSVEQLKIESLKREKKDLEIQTSKLQNEIKTLEEDKFTQELFTGSLRGQIDKLTNDINNLKKDEQRATEALREAKEDVSKQIEGLQMISEAATPKKRGIKGVINKIVKNDKIEINVDDYNTINDTLELTQRLLKTNKVILDDDVSYINQELTKKRKSLEDDFNREHREIRAELKSEKAKLKEESQNIETIKKRNEYYEEFIQSRGQLSDFNNWLADKEEAERKKKFKGRIWRRQTESESVKPVQKSVQEEQKIREQPQQPQPQKEKLFDVEKESYSGSAFDTFDNYNDYYDDEYDEYDGF